MDKTPTPVLILILLGLLLIIAFSSGTEVAMLSVNRYRVRHRASLGQRRARMLERLLSEPDRWLGANLVILALASVAATTVVNVLALRTGHRLALPIMALLLAVVMIVFCELAPKIYAAVHAEPLALGSAYIYRVLLWITGPINAVTNQIALGFLRLFGVRPRSAASQTLSTEELRTVVSEASTLVPQRHRQMLLSILDLERVSVNDIMIPRQEIAAIDLAASWEDILEQLRTTPHSRLPVYEHEFANIIGILHMKRVAQELARGSLTHARLRELAAAREPYFVPDGTPLTQQLAQFQRTRRRLAFVVDEYGDIVGLVTLEDILEEIVGSSPTIRPPSCTGTCTATALAIGSSTPAPRSAPSIARSAGSCRPSDRARSTGCCSSSSRPSPHPARRCASDPMSSRSSRSATMRSAPCGCGPRPTSRRMHSQNEICIQP